MSKIMLDLEVMSTRSDAEHQALHLIEILKTGLMK